MTHPSLKMNKYVNANPEDGILGVAVVLINDEIRDLIQFLRAVSLVYIQTNGEIGWCLKNIY